MSIVTEDTSRHTTIAECLGSADDAHLIAAAPELYEALKKLLDVEKSDLTGGKWKIEIISAIRQAERALAKARQDKDSLDTQHTHLEAHCSFRPEG